MSKRAEEISASAILPESIISYAKEHAVLSGLVYREGVKYGYEQAEKKLVPLINRLCEAILFEWKDAAGLARKILTQIKETEGEQ